ncbi:putative bifunctional diguanylate cyclase/phosphodiesterase [Thalassotalea crassostreae]|uniref:putative bifunctional diguanylate cyclase/phosphodiesterase n=1 Tax=Thalassotalea crassostreae TaxID=1763536 RepID=UPI0008382E14|nr:EAL domain-containing protein [Thalassotalea crassostreae]
MQKKSDKITKLLDKYRQTKRIQKGLLKLSELAGSVTDMACFYPNLQQIIRQYFPTDNLYIQLFTEPDSLNADHFYIDESICSKIDQQLSGDMVEFISGIEKPVLINHHQVSILEQDNNVSVRPFPKRHSQTQLVDVWLAAPLIMGNVSMGLVGVKGFINPDNSARSNLEMIHFIALHIASAIVRNRASEQLKVYSKDLEDIIFDRTKRLQRSNFNLRKQVEERRKSELKLFYEAHHDPLTKLPNRSMFSDRLEHSIKHLKRHPNHRFAVLFIDLDRFKIINDTLGHHVGDKLLVQIADRIAQCIRGNDILARLGGDEFVILLDSISSNDDAEEIATRIIEAIALPFTIEQQQLYSSASIGISICDQQYNSASEILRDADAAMYQAKSIGNGRLMFFDKSMREQLLANLNLERELRTAIKEQQFALHFQKITELHEEKAIGFEALLRWQHPQRGLLSPADFLELAEETSLILDIEDWVLKTVAKQIKLWQQDSALKHAFISVNLSGKHVWQTQSVRELSTLISNNFDRPEQLIIEFNEHAFNRHPKQSLSNLELLKKSGVRLALDDYGSGISSLNYLSKYPFELIKLDRSFVRSLCSNPKNLELAKSLSQIGDNFGFRLVAEGIESQQQLDMVVQCGCEYGQGFFISKPKSIENTSKESGANNNSAINPSGNIDHCA